MRGTAASFFSKLSWKLHFLMRQSLFCSIAFSPSIVRSFVVRRSDSSANSIRQNPFQHYHSSSSSSYQQEDFELLVKAATSAANGFALGGDFAGLTATFDPGDGSFIPVPQHLVPEELLEWGQEPRCLEVLVSEELRSEENGEDTMARTTVTVLPATGCAVDNLETVKVEDDVDLTCQWGAGNVIGLQYQVGDEEIRLETVFGMDDGYRMRAAINIIPSDSVFAVQSPMVLCYERRTNAVGTAGGNCSWWRTGW